MNQMLRLLVASHSLLHVATFRRHFQQQLHRGVRRRRRHRDGHHRHGGGDGVADDDGAVPAAAAGSAQRFQLVKIH